MELRDITVTFGEKTVLDRFSMTIPQKGILCLFGPSGCGKTTLLRVLCGLETPVSGTLSRVPKTAAVFQEDRLLPWCTIQSNLTTAAGISVQEAERWLTKMGLSGEAASYPDSLSGGMQRRVAMARALAADSDLLLLDEPFTGLDQATKELLYPLIREAGAQKPVILVTHHRDEAEALGAEILELDGPPLRIRQL